MGKASRRWFKGLLGALAGGLLIGGFGPAVPSAVAAPTTMVDLGQASTYGVLSGASVGNTVNAVGAPHTTLRGDLGVKANTQPTGFPPTLKLKPKGAKTAAQAAFKKIKTAAKQGKRVTATITIELVDAAGNTRDVKLTK